MRLLPHSTVPCLRETAVLRPNPSSTSWMSEGFSLSAKGSEAFRTWLWALARCLMHPFPHTPCVSAMRSFPELVSPDTGLLPRSPLSYNSNLTSHEAGRQKWHALGSVVSGSCIGDLSHLCVLWSATCK